MQTRKPKERGFTFVETLIAAAIAAISVTMAAQSLIAANRLESAARELRLLADEAAVLRLRIESGVDDSMALAGLRQGWTIERISIVDSQNRDAPIFDEVRISVDGGYQFSLSFWSRHREDSHR